MLISSPPTQFSYPTQRLEAPASKEVKSQPSSTLRKQTDLGTPSKQSIRPEKESLDEDISAQIEIQKLKSLDREVKAHELAHVSAGGQYITSGAQFRYQRGPDGRLYAVSGEVGIDTAEIPGDPRATLLKAQVVIRAALAPSNPSAQDRQVAAQASVQAQAARIELALLVAENNSEPSGRNLDVFI